MRSSRLPSSPANGEAGASENGELGHRRLLRVVLVGLALGNLGTGGGCLASP